MDRRTLLAAGATTALGLMAGLPAAAQTGGAPGRKPFKLRYAPHFGQFKEHAGEDLIDQLKFMADEGFTALEDNGMLGRPVEMQEKIAGELERLGMAMGEFVVIEIRKEPSFVKRDAAIRDGLVGEITRAIETAKRLNTAYLLVVPGPIDPKLDWGFQTANVIDNLRACAEVAEAAGKVILIEPLNARSHPGLFLTRSGQAYSICRAVNSPACKIVFDVFHQQITEGDLMTNIDLAWDEIAYFHLGDAPGRKEPGTGEINFRNLFRHIHGKGYRGILGMEHKPSKPGKEGERALIDAYRAADDFEV